MSTILAMSVAGSPGVTTTALALTLSWPQSVMLIEADTSRYSSVLPGYFRGQVAHARGIGELPVASNNSGSLDINQVWAQTISLVEETNDGPERRLVPGFRDPAIARAMDPVWGHLGTAASSFEGMGMDVIFDAGRWNTNDSRSSILRICDGVIIVARPTLPDIVALHKRLPTIRTELAVGGREDNITLLLVEQPSGPQLSSAEIRKAVGIQRTERLAWDDKTASIFSHGEPGMKRFEKTKYGRTLLPAIETIRTQLAEQRSRLDQNRDKERDARR
ncbi:MAG TPA: hypothetical protein VGP24_04425 [Glaciihabitans sp.]|jgi:hypothetical protein|nr:hypothetical protein [Glaciihabitans sp.]